jgi:cysteine-rich repeat protein
MNQLNTARKAHVAVAFIFLVSVALPAFAQSGSRDGNKCESGKNITCGKYASCIYKAQSKFVRSGRTDTERYEKVVVKCNDRYSSKWQSLEDRADGACPSTGDETDIQDFIDACILSTQDALGGGTLPSDVITCLADLTTCNDDFGNCNADLATASNDLTTCSTNLTNCDGERSTCTGDLATCNVDLASSLLCGNGVLDAGEDCDYDWANSVVVDQGSTCVDEGFDGGDLTCGSGCAYDESGCRVCGDGFTDPPEECDDGNTANGDGCDASCAQECSVVFYEDWEPGDDGAWNGWAGYHQLSGGKLELVRTSTQWGQSSRDLSSHLNNSLRLTVGLTLKHPQSQIMVCLVDTGSTDGEISYTSGSFPGTSHGGYCVVLNDETQNGSRAGIQLIANKNSTNGEGPTVIEKAFTPVVGQEYSVQITRDSSGNWALFVDGKSEGTATDLQTTLWDAVTVEAGRDNCCEGGGFISDLRIRIESDYACNATCGDGFTDAPEECDDGNTTSGDGCDAACASELPAGYNWVQYPANGHYYALTDAKRWDAVREEANALGDPVVFSSIDAAEEQEWLESQYAGIDFWIGLSDALQEGIWEWESGAPYSYTNWTLSNPSNSSGVEHYVIVEGYAGKWNDLALSVGEIRGLLEFVTSPDEY